MKCVIVMILVCFCSANVLLMQQQDPNDEHSCHRNVLEACHFPERVGHFCDARYGGIDHIEAEVQSYINTQLMKSYEYLLLATHYNSYLKHRPGFQKLYKSLSDRSFDDAMELMRHITRRGGKVNFNSDHSSTPRLEIDIEVDELHSIALALDNEKLLSKAAMHVHNRAMAAGGKDPHIANYMQQHHMDGQSRNVRILSGYANDLAKLMSNEQDASLAIYLFDKHLQNQLTL